MVSRKFFALAVALLIVTALLVPTFAQDEEVPPAGEGGIIVEAYFGSDPVPLNPLVCMESSCIEAAGFLLPSLIKVDPETANFTESGAGAIATGWEISEDNLVYTITLREDYNWNDGTPVTAQDFVYSFNAIASGELLNTLYVTVLDTVESMEALDDHTLQVTLRQPDCRALANISVPPLPSHIMPEEFADLNESDYNQNPTVTAGVFNFSSLEPSAQLALSANPDYPDAVYGYVVPTGFIFKNVPDQTVMIEQFLAGEDVNYLDVPLNARRLDIRAAAEAGEFQVVEYEGLVWDYLAFNLADPTNPQDGLDADGNPIPQGYHPIFGNVQVRQALAHGVDIDAIIEAAAFGEGSRMTSYLTASSWAYHDELPPRAYDPELAGQLLDEVGWVDHDSDPSTPRQAQGVTLPDGTAVEDGTPLSFTMIGNEGNSRRAAEGQLIQDQLSQIGVEAIYQAVDFGTWVERVNAQDFDAVMLAWQSGYPDDPDGTQLFTGLGDVVGATNNIPSWYNAEFIELNEQARTLPGCDQEARAEIYRQMQEIAQEDMPYLWMYSLDGLYAARSNIANFDPRPGNAFWNVDAWYVR